MLTKNLFNSLLVEPAKIGANKLFIVSGYATAAMAFHHLDILRKIKSTVSINLIIGMTPVDGLSISNHRGFRALMENEFPENFSCSYITKAPVIHSKIYSWFHDKEPIVGFVGSANYTQRAFSKSQLEAVEKSDASLGYSFFNSVLKDSIYCNHSETESLIQIYNEQFVKKLPRELLEGKEPKSETEPANDFVGLPSVTISLLDRKGELPDRSGLNWGQRPDQRREPNQAYIRLPSEVYNSDFFPSRTVHFTILTDDSKVLICTRAQDNGKAIHTPHNNSLIGEYFRNRLGLPSGSLVKTKDLINYGRTDITFYRIDDETYYMDFSV